MQIKIIVAPQKYNALSLITNKASSSAMPSLNTFSRTCSSITTAVISLIFVFDCSINSDGYGSFSHRHLPHISFYFYQRGTGPKYGSGVPCLPLKKSLGVGQTHCIGQWVMHHSKKMTDLWHLVPCNFFLL